MLKSQHLSLYCGSNKRKLFCLRKLRWPGFTVIELVLVILLISILAIAALPRFFDANTFASRSFFDQAVDLIRYSQKIAIAQGRTVFLNVNAANRTICATYVADTACASTSVVLSPVDRTNKLSITAPTNITFSLSGSISFSPLGVPNPNAAVSLSIVGDGVTRTITVEQETGYVH